MKVKQRVGWLCTNDRCEGFFWLATLTADQAAQIEAKVNDLARGAHACCPKCGAKFPVWRLDRGPVQLEAEQTARLDWEKPE